jgi:hypothetical protein
MFKIANEPPVDILTVNPNVPPGLAAFLNRALAKNPEDRFRDGVEFAGALRASVAATAGASTAAAAKPADGVDIEL